MKSMQQQYTPAVFLGLARIFLLVIALSVSQKQCPKASTSDDGALRDAPDDEGGLLNVAQRSGEDYVPDAERSPFRDEGNQDHFGAERSPVREVDNEFDFGGSILHSPDIFEVANSTSDPFTVPSDHYLTSPVENVEDDDYKSRIVGGQNCECGRYRSICALYAGKKGNAQICGGTLIGSNVILTAAHCSPVVKRARCNIYNKKDGPGGLPCGSGSGRLGSNDVVEEFNIVEKRDHPIYGTGVVGNSHDFSLLRLEKQSRQPPMKLLQDRSVLQNDMWLTVAGWGLLCEKVDYYGRPCATSSHCREVHVNYMPISECRKYYGKKRVTDDMMCAGVDVGGKDACQGDSGGALFIKGRAKDGSEDIMAGVVSWGRGCAREFSPGVYGSVVEQLEWITRNACSMGAQEMCSLFEKKRDEGFFAVEGRDTKAEYGSFLSDTPVEQTRGDNLQDQEKELETGEKSIVQSQEHQDGTTTNDPQLIMAAEEPRAIPMFYQCESIQGPEQCRDMSFKGRSGNIRTCLWVDDENPEHKANKCNWFRWCCPEVCEFDCTA